VHGTKRYVTGDESRNNWLLALFTMGEGWHNNHHAYQYAARQGFRWWEIDPTYYLIKGLEKLGVVWEIKEPPAAVLKGEHILPPRVIERSAERLLASLPVDAIVQAAHDAYAAAPSLSDLRERVAEAQTRVQARVSEKIAAMHLPEVPDLAWLQSYVPAMPSLEDMKARARAMYVSSPGLDQIAERAHAMLTQAVWAKLHPAKT
jgi:stearoyl-CoA desaturase (delta-9 desaturase)